MQLNILVELCRCLSSEVRVKIIKLLAERELCVCEIEEVTRQTQSSISQHLRILYSAGLVEKRRDGQWIYYKLNQSRYYELLGKLDDLFSIPLAESEDFLDEFFLLENLTSNERVNRCKSFSEKANSEVNK